MNARAQPDSPAFYALRGGGWRDYWTLLHPPYTLWHLSYVCIGWSVVPGRHVDRLIALLVAFFLAVGIGAHALDELNGRPLRTRIPSRVLVPAASIAIALAVAIGFVGAFRTTLWILLFVGAGGFIVLAYNLEWFGGKFHSDFWFAISWGAFPSFTASFAGALHVTVPALLAAGACAAISAAQRDLSTPVRDLRRRTRKVDGSITRTDGTRIVIDAKNLREAPERALRAMSIALPLIAITLVLARLQ
ncbi:MAG: hypothetical protein ACYDCC_13375 [Actinomycetota bacterium]